ncbi:MAG: DUF1178 family protein [Burkholderiales bacterium]
MIVFELICSGQHRFEGWFASPDDYNAQHGRGLLECPVCADKSIEKLLTAKIGRAETEVHAPAVHEPAPAVPMAAGQGLQAKLYEFIDHVLKNTEDVGPAFAEEARKIHYQEAPTRDIRGTATRAETEELLDEGIQVLPLPIPRRDDWH